MRAWVALEQPNQVQIPGEGFFRIVEIFAERIGGTQFVGLYSRPIGAKDLPARAKQGDDCLKGKLIKIGSQWFFKSDNSYNHLPLQ